MKLVELSQIIALENLTFFRAIAGVVSRGICSLYMKSLWRENTVYYVRKRISRRVLDISVLKRLRKAQNRQK